MILVDLIASATNAVLGLYLLRGDRELPEIGFSSLAVLELAQALSAATGLGLPPSLLFDHPTPLALATHLQRELGLASVSDNRPSAPPAAS